MRHFALLSVALCLALVLCRTSTIRAAGPLDPEQIKAALQTAEQEDDGFIERAVDLVNAGKLPRDIFDSCFLWARNKPRHKFQYFKRALVIRAAEAGVQISGAN